MVLARDLDGWFKAEVLRHEQALTRLLRRHIRDTDEVKDLRQDVYVKLYESVKDGLSPSSNVWPLMHTMARNLLIDRSRKAKVISIELAIDPEDNLLPIDLLTPERYASDRDDLRHFERGVRSLPDRCRQAIILRKIEGLSQQECARRMSISEGTLEAQVQKGMRLLTDFMLGGLASGNDRRVRKRRMFQK